VPREYDKPLPRICAYSVELNQVWTKIIVDAIEAMHKNCDLRPPTCIRGFEAGGYAVHRATTQTENKGAGEAMSECFHLDQEATRHPIMQSIEPGEHGGWCFIDEVELERV
jgi:hypothetical protein